jgi:hypothetical protein
MKSWAVCRDAILISQALAGIERAKARKGKAGRSQ